jgi:uncharacterized membrane protein HdeD (DUF308 family)
VEDLATRFAELLESSATKVRSMTVDRARSAVTLVSLALPLTVFAIFAGVFLFMTIHTTLAILVGQWGSYAIQAGLFLIAGALIWVKRTPKEVQ